MCHIHGYFGVILVHMVPASHTVNEAFAYAIRTVWFKEVYEKWAKRHQKCINYAGEYFEKE